MKVTLLNNISRLFKIMKIKGAKHAPKILIGAGIAGGTTAAVIACKRSMDLRPILDECKSDISDAEESVYTDENAKRKCIRGAKIKCAKKVLKHYALPGAIGLASAAAIVGGAGLLDHRNAQLTAELTTAVAAGNELRKKFKNALGNEKYQEIAYGVKEEKVKEEIVDEKGKKKTVIKTNQTVDTANLNHGLYSFFFDASSRFFIKNPEVNKSTLLDIQAEMNMRLHDEGYLFLNDVLGRLDIEKVSYGWRAGWTIKDLDPNCDGFIDFGIFDPYDPAKRRFVNGLENVILLDMNCQGDITSKVRWRR